MSDMNNDTNIVLQATSISKTFVQGGFNVQVACSKIFVSLFMSLIAQGLRRANLRYE